MFGALYMYISEFMLSWSKSKKYWVRTSWSKPLIEFTNLNSNYDISSTCPHNVCSGRKISPFFLAPHLLLGISSVLPKLFSFYMEIFFFFAAWLAVRPANLRKIQLSMKNNKHVFCTKIFMVWTPTGHSIEMNFRLSNNQIKH